MSTNKTINEKILSLLEITHSNYLATFETRQDVLDNIQIIADITNLFNDLKYEIEFYDFSLKEDSKNYSEELDQLNQLLHTEGKEPQKLLNHILDEAVNYCESMDGTYDTFDGVDFDYFFEQNLNTFLAEEFEEISEKVEENC